MKATKESSDNHFKTLEKKLVPLGFRILNDKGRIDIFHEALPNSIDMSALDPKKIIYIVYNLGKANGRTEKLDEIRNVLGIGEGENNADNYKTK